MTFQEGVLIHFKDSHSLFSISDLKQGRGCLFICPSEIDVGQHKHQCYDVLKRTDGHSPVVIEAVLVCGPSTEHSGAPGALGPAVQAPHVASLWRGLFLSPGG